MIKILSIGNSFSQDAQRYLHQIAENQGVQLECVNLYVARCSLEMHWKNWASDLAVYAYELNGQKTSEYISIFKALKMEPWDYVTVQQASNFSTDYGTYMPYLKDIVEQIRKYAPTAKVLMHQTWAYKQGSQRLVEEMGYQDQHEMLRDIRMSYARAAEDIGAVGLIPCGDALMYALDNGIENVHRDSFHASRGIGRYILGLVWYLFLTGNTEIQNHILLDEPAADHELRMAVEAARYALKLT